MRKNGWQLPYHPLQVVAIAVFLALGFAFYVFFMPFVGKKVLQYVVMGIYTLLVTCVFGLYIWCAATDPGDPGVFKSTKYRNVKGYRNACNLNSSRREGSINEVHCDLKMDSVGTSSSQRIKRVICFLPVLISQFSLSFVSGWCCSLQPSSENKTSEDGMFYCSICEVEVRSYSKHCRVCDKCVDHFDHHCRWLNNCIGRKNYGRFFALMTSSLILLILQWLIGVMVLILCFLDRKRYSMEIMSKLGSSFSLAPFTVVVASCTFLAMLATLPLAQLFFFHVLLIKKGISTYDYIVALREEQQGLGQQSPQMSSVSSLNGFSSASSFNTFQRASWCTPPRLFLEDQFDVIPQEINMSVNSDGKKRLTDESKKGNKVNIKLNPWTLARLNSDEVSKAAMLARNKSKILVPISKQLPLGNESDSQRRCTKKIGRVPMELPLQPLAKISASGSDSSGIHLATEASSNCLAPLQLEARSAFRASRAISGVYASSPDSSLGSPDLHPFRISSSGAEDSQRRTSLNHRGDELLRSTSDGYEASGGEDSDMVPSRIVHRSLNWSSVILKPDRNERPGSGYGG